MSGAGLLRPDELAETGRWLAAQQLPNGMIPWYPGGHADPWNHTEVAMALAVSGQVEAARAAYEWLASTQLADGSWCLYYLAEGVEEPRRDPNVCAYVAAGVWWHFLETGDRALLERMWPVVSAALEFVLGLQAPGGEILWNRDVDGHPGSFALLTGNSSILHSLRCGVAIAEHLGLERPDWELCAARVAGAILHRPEAFVPKDRWAMDWYYPVLSGAVQGEAARAHLERGMELYVMDGLGVRCVNDHPWVTAAESAECVMALDAAGCGEQAAALLAWTRHLRTETGGYWTGCVHPQCVRFPGGECSTYGTAAVVMAHHVLGRSGPAAGLFRGDTLPAGFVELSAVPVGDREF